MSSLYFHFPFCETKCHYCDFYSLGREKTKMGDPTLFEKAMIEEVKMRGEAGDIPAELDTIFLGGGTPSMTEPESMQRIFGELFKYTKLAPNAEWTMEANPSSISLDQFKAYRALGINRVSMGVQSLRNDHLAKLGRVHNEGEALVALDTLFAAGFTNVSTDLLCGVPGQTTDDLYEHMLKLSGFPITHLSIYLLTLTKTHKMFKDLPNEDEQLKHLLFIDQHMRARGFEHYEISNFARPGHQARHNLVYWKNSAYLSFGPSAHSYSVQGEVKKRFKNFSSLHRYAKELIDEKKLPVEWTEELTPDQSDLEKWMLAIRLAEGFPKAWLLSDRQKNKSATFLNEGLLEIHPDKPDYLRATPTGFALSDGLTQNLCS
jgi:putative oxygen-independent coproporphyrinogen III oxidase